MSKIDYNQEQVQSVFDANPTENSIIVTSCGNVFHTHHEAFAKNHCREAKSEYQVLTRDQFNAESNGGKSKTPLKADPSSTDWRELRFKEIVEFAKSKGLEAKTKTNKGTVALIEEVEAFLATLEPVGDEEIEEDLEAEDSKGSDYTPVGSENLDSENKVN
jgi:hypothetical protein